MSSLAGRNAPYRLDRAGGAVSTEPSRPAWAPRRVRDLPCEDRPRERLARHGPGALSNRELVALLIGSGSVRASALDLAEALLGSGLRGLASRSLAELQGQPGLGSAKATRVLAALELGARLASEGRGEAPVFRTPEECARHLLPRYAARPVETFGLLALDVRHRLKREAVISVGCLTSSLVHPREVFQEAVACRAAALILFHNHPSGDPEPSAEDLSLTRRLASAGTLMGIEVLDHVVLGAGRIVSLKERGVL
jgi:DNA repair protein RadC